MQQRWDDGRFGDVHFATVDLGDQRRNRRCREIANRLHERPGSSLPDKCRDPAAYRACVRLMNHPEVTHAALLEPHLQRTRQLVHDFAGPVVRVFDFTELDYSGQHLPGLGQIGNGHGRGYECFNGLAVDPATRRPLGLVCQFLHCRAQVSPQETRSQRHERANRESRLWLAGAEQAGPPPSGKCWIDVADRAADTFEFLCYEHAHGHPYVIRSQHDRNLEVAAGDAGPTHLHAWLRSLPAATTWTVSVSAQAGQPAREAVVSAAWERVRIRRPVNDYGATAVASLEVWAIRVWEGSPPAGVAALEWLLLTNVAIATVDDAKERVDWYTCRTVIEEYHKAQKTGAGVERLQFQSRQALEPMIAMLSVVAVALLDLRSAARSATAAEQPAAAVMGAVAVRVLSVWRYGEERPLTIREFTLALARLGGHQNRKCDGLPGWLTLWRGWHRLEPLIEYELSRSRCGKH